MDIITPDCTKQSTSGTALADSLVQLVREVERGRTEMLKFESRFTDPMARGLARDWAEQCQQFISRLLDTREGYLPERDAH